MTECPRCGEWRLIEGDVRLLCWFCLAAGDVVGEVSGGRGTEE